MPRNNDSDPIVRILRRREVEARTGLARSRIYDMIRVRKFPEPVPLGPHSVGWLESEIVAWIAARVAERKKPYPPRGRRPAKRDAEATP